MRMNVYITKRNKRKNIALSLIHYVWGLGERAAKTKPCGKKNWITT